MHTVYGEALPTLKQALIQLTVGQSTSYTWVSVMKITAKFILKLANDLKHCKLKLGAEVLLCYPGIQP